MSKIEDRKWTDNTYTRVSRASSEKTPEDVLAQLAEYNDDNVRWIVAGNYSASTATLRKLKEDSNAEVRRRAIK
ncbi:MAG: hypothetical protein ACREF7_01905, partial [Candidatus Saccharimonadales bacterium]